MTVGLLLFVFLIIAAVILLFLYEIRLAEVIVHDSVCYVFLITSAFCLILALVLFVNS